MARPLEPFPDYSDEPQTAYDTTHQPVRPKKSMTATLLLILTIVILLGIGSAVFYWIAIRHNASKSNTNHTASSIEPSSAASSGGTITYTSNGQDLNLNFDYPTGWKATPASGKNTADQPITVSSPQTGITNSKGEAVTGKVIVTIRPGSSEITELASGTAVIAQDSEQIGYTKPTASQHQYPYLTYIRLSGSTDVANGFDEVIITGTAKFTKGQNLSPEGLGPLDPIISARFYTCASTCAGPNAATLEITPNTWQYSDVFTQTLSLFESLQLR